MKQLALSVFVLSVFLASVVACDTGNNYDEAKKEAAPPAEAMKDGEAPAEAEPMKDGEAPAEETALMAPAGSPGQAENDEGVGQYKQGNWDVAAGHFRKAVKADAKLAEAHFNLAMSLDKLGTHGEATEHFRQAADLAPDNPKIKDSANLKKHIGM
ncbi:MAG: tetratricopeptide repeat protein [Nitrospirae bacterium]|nr:tetratricopeptide repeat protein [Nitrospirota bacterium]